MEVDIDIPIWNPIYVYIVAPTGGPERRLAERRSTTPRGATAAPPLRLLSGLAQKNGWNSFYEW